MNHSSDHDPIEQMNTHRAEELRTIARTLGATPNATAAHAQQVDTTGIDITIDSPHGSSTRHIEFLEPIDDYPAGIRVAFVRLARHAENTLKQMTEEEP